MTYRRLLSFLMVFVAMALVSSSGIGWVWAEQKTDQTPKEVRDPHLVHFEIGKDIPPIGFAVREVKDWPGFVRALQSRLDDLSFSNEMQLLIRSLFPQLVSEDEKKVLLSEINKMLRKPDLHSRLQGKVDFSPATKSLRTAYLQTRMEEDLQWLNRSLINDIIPPSPRVAVEDGKRFNKLRKINCLTCHEAWSESGTVPAARPLTELEKLEKMISAQMIAPSHEPALIKGKTVTDDDYLRQYENLKKFIIRADTHGNPALIEAVHPENPYTYKPLLKRLVCVGCHALGRPVDKIEHADGTTHQIKYLYGPIEGTKNEAHSR